jgi:hypothetical protein
MNTSLKAKLLCAAHEVLKEKGVWIPFELKICVYENTPDKAYFVIPRVPAEGSMLNDLEMRAFVEGEINNLQGKYDPEEFWAA